MLYYLKFSPQVLFFVGSHSQSVDKLICLNNSKTTTTTTTTTITTTFSTNWHFCEQRWQTTMRRRKENLTIKLHLFQTPGSLGHNHIPLLYVHHSLEVLKNSWLPSYHIVWVVDWVRLGLLDTSLDLHRRHRL